MIQTATSLGDVLAYAYTLTGQVLRERSGEQLTEYTYDELGRVINVEERELAHVEVPVSITIKLDPNGGELSGSNTYVVWSIGTVSLPIPYRVGYGFEDWSPTPNGSGNEKLSEILAELVAAGGTEITLYAIWDKTPDATVPTVPTFPTTPPVVAVYSLRSTGNSYIKTYTYDLAGNRTSFVLTKDGAAVHNIKYTYDDMNRLLTVYQGSNHRATYTYDANGNRISLKYATGTLTTYTYNKANWVTGMTSVDNGTTLADYSYTYYASGNQQSETDSVNGTVTSYVYDDLGRLTQESETGGLTIAYTYNSAGNRAKMAVTGTQTYTTTYTYDANNRLTQESKKTGSTTATTTYTYDANGNLIRKSTSKGAERYDYNGFNQLTILKQGTTATGYAYNASGIRTAKHTESTDTYFLLEGGKNL